MREFIKNKLKENLNQPETKTIEKPFDFSKISIKQVFVNGKTVFIPLYDGVKIGSFRLVNYADNYRIDSVTLLEEFRKKGIGKRMYLYIIKSLKKMGKILYSDKNQSQDAQNVWNSLISIGAAEKNEFGYNSTL
jgi:GNAT superfamily N-acetyltransferase